MIGSGGEGAHNGGGENSFPVEPTALVVDGGRIEEGEVGVEPV